jgi:hypothetical protein
MPSQSETIIEALKVSIEGITGLPVPLTGVYRSRADAFSRREAPAVVVEPGVSVPTMSSICRMDWEDEILFAIYTRGMVPDQLADPIRVAIHAAVMAQRRLVGGVQVMDIAPGKVERELEGGDVPSMWTLCRYVVSHRTSITDLTS